MELDRAWKALVSIRSGESLSRLAVLLMAILVVCGVVVGVDSSDSDDPFR